MHGSSRGTTYRLLDRLNRLICRVLYQVTPLSPSPLPQSGPVLLVSDHSSYSDPMVLAATANRPIIFLTAREVYPINRGTQDVGAVRAMLRALRQGEVIGIFPEGALTNTGKKADISVSDIWRSRLVPPWFLSPLLGTKRGPCILAGVS